MTDGPQPEQNPSMGPEDLGIDPRDHPQQSAEAIRGGQAPGRARPQSEKQQGAPEQGKDEGPSIEPEVQNMMQDHVAWENSLPEETKNNLENDEVFRNAANEGIIILLNTGLDSPERQAARNAFNEKYKDHPRKQEIDNLVFSNFQNHLDERVKREEERPLPADSEVARKYKDLHEEAQDAMQQFIANPHDPELKILADKKLKAVYAHAVDEHTMEHIKDGTPLWYKGMTIFGVMLYLYVGAQAGAAKAMENAFKGGGK